MLIIGNKCNRLINHFMFLDNRTAPYYFPRSLEGPYAISLDGLHGCAMHAQDKAKTEPGNRTFHNGFLSSGLCRGAQQKNFSTALQSGYPEQGRPRDLAGNPSLACPKR